MKRFPNGYNDTNLPPNLKEDLHFQNWMRTAGLPTFTKLYGRNDADTMVAGTYQIVIGLSASASVKCGMELTSRQTSRCFRTRAQNLLSSPPFHG